MRKLSSLLRAKWKRLVGVLFLLTLCAIGFLLFALSPSAMPKEATQWFDLSKIRALAHKTTPFPDRIDVVNVAESQNPAAITYGWGGPDDLRFVGYCYRVSSSNRRVVIEAPANEETLRKYLPFVSMFSTPAFQLSQRWLSEADVIVATHEHFDHISGLVQHPEYKTIAKKAFVTQAQIDGPEMEKAGFEPAAKALLTAVHLDQPTLIAPGMVAIPASGHTPGSIWIYVVTTSGREILFVGDTAWHHENIDLPRGTPRVVSWGLHANGERIADQLLFLHQFQEQHSEIAIVAAHDPLHHQRLIDDGTFHLVVP